MKRRLNDENGRISGGQAAILAAAIGSSLAAMVYLTDLEPPQPEPPAVKPSQGKVVQPLKPKTSETKPAAEGDSPRAELQESMPVVVKTPQSASEAVRWEERSEPVRKQVETVQATPREVAPPAVVTKVVDLAAVRKDESAKAVPALLLEESYPTPLEAKAAAQAELKPQALPAAPKGQKAETLNLPEKDIAGGSDIAAGARPPAGQKQKKEPAQRIETKQVSAPPQAAAKPKAVPAEAKAVQPIQSKEVKRELSQPVAASVGEKESKVIPAVVVETAAMAVDGLLEAAVRNQDILKVETGTAEISADEKQAPSSVLGQEKAEQQVVVSGQGFGKVAEPAPAAETISKDGMVTMMTLPKMPGRLRIVESTTAPVVERRVVSQSSMILQTPGVPANMYSVAQLSDGSEVLRLDPRMGGQGFETAAAEQPQENTAATEITVFQVQKGQGIYQGSFGVKNSKLGWLLTPGNEGNRVWQKEESAEAKGTYMTIDWGSHLECDFFVGFNGSSLIIHPLDAEANALVVETQALAHRPIVSAALIASLKELKMNLSQITSVAISRE